MRIQLKLLSILFLLMISTNSYAVKNYHEMNYLELQLLPPFCQSWYRGARESSAKDKLQYEVWNNKLGPIPHPHHLCPGLNALNHAQSLRDKSAEKRFALVEAGNNLSYVLGHEKVFPIRSTVLVKRGNVYEMQGDFKRSAADYQEAIEIKSKNTYAYIALAELYLKSKNKKESLNIIEKGLKFSPTSKRLLRLRKKLGQ